MPTNNKKGLKFMSFCYQGMSPCKGATSKYTFLQLNPFVSFSLPAQSLNPDYSSFTKQNNVDRVKWQDVFQKKSYLTVCCKQNADGLLCFL